MVWIDIPIIIFLVVFAYAGWGRGFIGELFDVLILIVGNCIAIALYYYIADFFIKLTGFNLDIVYPTTYLMVLIPVSVGLFLLGRFLEKRSADGFPQQLYRSLGVILGFIKGILLAFLFFLLISTLQVSSGKVKLLKSSMAIRMIQSTESMVEGMIVAFAPQKIKASAIQTLRRSIFENRK